MSVRMHDNKIRANLTCDLGKVSKNFHILLIFGIGIVISFAGSWFFCEEVTTIKDRDKPDIVFVEYNYNFGEVKQGEIVNHVYEFVNAGKEDLIIKDVKSSCGCTAVLLSSKNIPPDGTGEIEVNLDTTELNGRITKTITIYSNDIEEPSVILSISCVVKGNASLLSNQHAANPLDCGPKSLAVICTYFGIPATLKELSDLSGLDSNGTTILGLKKAAEAKGLKAVGMRINTDYLRKIRTPVIAHSKNRHFFVAEAVKGGKFKVIEPTGDERILSTSELENYWDNGVLVISRKTLEGRGPYIKFDKYLHDFGEINQGEEIVYKYKFKNIGKDTLVIAEIKTICNCIQGRVRNKIIPVGLKGEMEVNLKTEGLRGMQMHKVYVHTNDPDNKIVQLTIMGRILRKDITYYPQQLYFDEMYRGQSLVKQIILQGPEDSSMKILRAHINRFGKDTTMKNSVLKVVSWRHSKQRVESDRRANKDFVLEVECKIPENAPFGKFQYVLEVQTSMANKSRIKIPIKGEVRSNIKVSPEALILVIDDRGELKRTISILGTKGERLEIQQIEISEGLPLRVTQSPTENGNINLEIRCLASEVAVGTTEGEMTCVLSDDVIFKIPVFIHK